VEVFHATDPDGQLWRIEVTATASDVKAKAYRAAPGMVYGKGEELLGVDALGRWLARHGLSVDDLEQR
jgi:hypothetical protein